MGDFISMSTFCSNLESVQCPTDMCVLPDEPQTLLSWASNVCNLTTDAQNQWNDSTSERDEAYRRLTSVSAFERWPSCGDGCHGLADSYTSSFFSESCINLDITAADRCFSSKPLVNTSNLCTVLVDTDACADACTFGKDPRKLFEWVNSTCAQELGDMENWRDATMAKEQKWLDEWIPALLPWNWTVQAFKQSAVPSSTGVQVTDPYNSSTPYISVSPSGPGTCPSSTTEKLGVFAIVNVISALLLPILGRRTVVSRLTFGVAGRLGSNGWAYMGVLSAALHISANLVNARVIRSTRGYGDVPFGALALLWCTRPRLAWLAVFLATREVEDGIYLNSGASAIVSEAILQTLGAIYFGITANYGRKKRFFYANHLEPYPRGVDAHIMYAGALVWLLALFFTLFACIVSILGLNEVISNARKMMGEVERVAGAGAKAINVPLQRMLPKWVKARIARRQRQLEEGPKEAPRKLTPTEIEQIKNVWGAGTIFVAFMAQWLFWAGFIRAAGER